MIMRARTVFFAAALAFPAVAAHGCMFRMALEQWPPYIYSNAKGESTGMDLELTRAILKEAGCTLTLETELPPARRQVVFEQGGLDLLLAASDTPERRRYARFSTAYRHEAVGLFTRPDRLARYQRLDSLDAVLRLQAPLLAPKVGWYGSGYADAISKLEGNGRLSTFTTFEQGVRMLKAGRADLILGDRNALRYAARQQGVELAPLPFTVLRAPVHLMLNKANTTAAELARINAAIERLEQRGVLAGIRDNYGERRDDTARAP
jgi:polar amino acid transport system substrate-binding protein